MQLTDLKSDAFVHMAVIESNDVMDGQLKNSQLYTERHSTHVNWQLFYSL